MFNSSSLWDFINFIRKQRIDLLTDNNNDIDTFARRNFEICLEKVAVRNIRIPKKFTQPRRIIIIKVLKGNLL